MTTDQAIQFILSNKDIVNRLDIISALLLLGAVWVTCRFIYKVIYNIFK
jgi:hypothetical protein